MKKILIIILFQCIICVSIIAQQKWTQKIVGHQDWVNNLIIADGRNDGVQRIYGATDKGAIYEWTYNQESSGWTKELCSKVSSGPSGENPFYYALQAGNGRNDGKIRLYGVTLNGLSYEFYFNSETKVWEVKKLDRGGNYKPQNILIGDVRNDGVNRVIGGGISINNFTFFKVNEYTWNEDNNLYDINYLVDGYRDLFQGAMGDARNSGFNAVYLPDRYAGFIREYTWEGNSYSENNIAVNMEPHRIVIGDSHNDGVNRIYVSEGFTHQGGIPRYGYIKELSYENNSWSQTNIHGTSFRGYGRHELCIGAARSDDTKNRLYSVARDGAIVEHSYEDSKWRTVEIDAVSGATATIQVGKGRNDEVNRVYVAGDGGKILEYTHSKPTSISVIKKADNKVINFPNPCNESTTFQYNLLRTSDVKLTVFSTDNKLVYERIYQNQPVGLQNKTINCAKMPSGTYFYKVEINRNCIGANTLVITR